MERTNGNRYQTGFPDRRILHREFGLKWVDYKAPLHNVLTIAQQRKWPVWDSFGDGIWIMTAATEDEYRKLFGKPNWRDFWKPRYGEIDIERLLAEIT